MTTYLTDAMVDLKTYLEGLQLQWATYSMMYQTGRCAGVPVATRLP